MGEEQKDQILWGHGFQGWKYTYHALQASIKMMESCAGKPDPSILSSTQGAERHPQLVEIKLRVMELYVQDADDRNRKEIVKRKRADFETVKEEELTEIRGISNRIYDIMEEIEKAMDRPKEMEKAIKNPAKAEADEFANEWDAVAAEEGVGLNIGLENLEERRAEECTELSKFLSSRSGDVRLAAAEALAQAKDTRSLVDYAYEEVIPENRKKILEEILVAVRLGALVGGKECSMLLKMAEDIDKECAEKALAIALRLFSRNLLNDEQVGYLYLLEKGSKEGVGDGEEKADLSRKARLWMKMACSNEVDEKERASLFARVEEAVWMHAKLGEAEITMFASLTEKARGEAARRAWSLVMELLEKNQLSKEQISGLVLHADTIEDKNERKRILDKMEGRLREMTGLGKKADIVLDAQRISNFLLETVTPGRPSGVPMRKSQPPEANGKRDSAPPEPQKA